MTGEKKVSLPAEQGQPSLDSRWIQKTYTSTPCVDYFKMSLWEPRWEKNIIISKQKSNQFWPTDTLTHLIRVSQSKTSSALRCWMSYTKKWDNFCLSNKNGQYVWLVIKASSFLSTILQPLPFKKRDCNLTKL